MKPELRAYILVTGRGTDGEPVRKLAKYTGAPLAGLTDNYEGMNATALRTLENNLRAEQLKLELALSNITAEKYDRLRRLDTHGKLEL